MHVFNLTLRGITIFFRFLLIFGISKYYPTESLGVYGLFNTTVTLVIFFLGFDFYAYLHRELFKYGKSKQVELLVNNLVFFALTYMVVLPTCLVVFFTNVLPVEFLFFFYIITIFEHFSQELYRLFVLFENQLFANVLLFVRMAAWIIPIFAYWVLADFENLSLKVIFSFWMAGSGSSVIIGLFQLSRKYREIKPSPSVNWQWIKKGMLVAVQYLAGTIAYKIIEFSDRYFLDYFVNKRAVGIYTFYYNFANLLQTLVFTLVISQLYPKLLLHFSRGENEQFLEYENKFKYQVLLTSLVGATVTLICIFPIVELLKKPEFYDNLLVYGLLIAAVTFLNLSFIPHYILYVKSRDRTIMVSTGICAIVNVVCNLTLTRNLGIVGSALSTLISYFALMVIKFYHLNNVQSKK